MDTLSSGQAGDKKEYLAERAVDALTQKYSVVGKNRFRFWRALFIFGIVAGLFTAIIFLAFRSQ